MVLKDVQMCELPFMVNIPGGEYVVPIKGTRVRLEVLQEQVAVRFNDSTYCVGSPDELSQALGEKYRTGFVQELRTLIRLTKKQDIEEIALPSVTEDDLVEDMISEVIQASNANIPHESLNQIAAQRLNGLGAEARKRFERCCKVRRYYKPKRDVAPFLAAINALIRLYMQRFNDFFVEEVTFLQLTSQSPIRGVLVLVTCDGDVVEHYGHCDKLPPLMRRPYRHHERTTLDEFKADLEAGIVPDSGSLLEVRAKAFLERGATRSAIIEVSAALELSIAKKLSSGFAKKGRSSSEIEDLLKAEIRFKERANKMMFEATGQRLSALDNTLYQKVLHYRELYRHRIAHSDAEPSVQEAGQTVKEMMALRKVVEAIVV